MNVTLTTDYELLKQLASVPDLVKLTYGPKASIPEVIIDTKFQYLLIQEGTTPMGFFQINELTKVTLEGHINLLPPYWGTRKSLEAVLLGHKWAREQGYLTMFSSVPSNCMRMLKWMKRVHYMPCGLIKNGVVYDNHLVSLILFEHDLIGQRHKYPENRPIGHNL